MTTLTKERTSEVEGSPPEGPEAEARARLAVRPSVQAALTAYAWGRAPWGMDAVTQFPALVAELERSMQALHEGDLRAAEALLTAQAHTLNAIFHGLARKAAETSQTDTQERYLRQAYKAQSQCRATLEALADLKSPRPVAYVGQANIGYNQQVNLNPSPTRKMNSGQNELLGVHDAQRLDTKTTGTAAPPHPHLETVGAVDRTEDGSR